MSWVHYTILGHFDPAQGSPRTRQPTRPIDLDLVNRLLAEYPKEVAACLTFRDGCVRWRLTVQSHALSAQLHEFARRLVLLGGGMVVADGREILYPPEAVAAQQEQWRQVRAASPQ